MLVLKSPAQYLMSVCDLEESRTTTDGREEGGTVAVVVAVVPASRQPVTPR